MYEAVIEALEQIGDMLWDEHVYGDKDIRLLHKKIEACRRAQEKEKHDT